MADNFVADSVLLIFDTENGNISDACDSYGTLFNPGRNGFTEAVVCIISGSNHFTADVSDFGSAAKWSFAASGADDLFFAVGWNG